MDRLHRKCDGLYQQLAHTKNYLDTIYDLKVADPKKVSKKQLELKRSAVDTYREKYESAYEELCESADDGDLKKVYADRGQFEDTYSDIVNMIEKIAETLFPDVKSEPVKAATFDVAGMMKELINSQRESTQELLKSVKELVDAKHAITKDPIQTQLPKLDLKSFSGGYTEWREFYDTFRCAVHDRDSLAPVQKLQYLKACLKGEAADLVKSLTLEDRNYELALKQLKSRYDNVKTIRDAHFHNIFSLPQLNNKSASGLRKLCSKLYENVQALHNLGEPTDGWDSWLVYILKVKLDPETRMEWEKNVSTKDHPKFKEMVDFLNEFATAMESAEQRYGNKGKRLADTSTRTQNVMYASSGSQRSVECFLCKEQHRLPQCPQFLALASEQRKSKVHELKLCLNCFSRQHFVASCTKPASCSQCGGKHHPTLHFGQNPGNDTRSVNITSHVVKPSSDTCAQEILLNTAMIHVHSGNGQPFLCRALLDPGSQTSFITSGFVQRARLKRNRMKDSVHVTGIGGTSKGYLDSYVDCEVSPCDQDNRISAQPLVIDKVTGKLPRHKVDVSNWDALQNVRLADKQFDTPGNIDILIGADIYPQILRLNQLRSPDGRVLAQETLFGWVLCGAVDINVNNCTSGAHVMSHFIDTESQSPDDILRRFWEIENVEEACAWSYEEKDCEAHFLRTFQRDADGRYIVSLPFKDGPEIGNSRSMAVKRFEQMERKLHQNLERLSQYSDVMNEYLELGHAEKVPPSELTCNNSYYMPQHCVIKESSTTTKLRVVFDASARSSSGVSLNDRLMVGPKVQNDLVNILTRFRTHPVALNADIAKMYRQLKLNPEDKDYHRFVWRESQNEPIVDYRMTAVTFGLASSPYQAQRVLKQLSIDERHRFLLAAPVLETDTYMDDLLSGERNTGAAIELAQQAIGLCQSGGFNLRKWISNEPSVMDSIPVEKREIIQTVDIDFDNSVTTKTLGVHWNPRNDMFVYKININDTDDEIVTKRRLLSQSARVFDPLGLVSPTMMKAKIMFQGLWLHGIEWDDAVPEDMNDQYLRWRRELKTLEDINIDRCIVPKDSDVIDYQLHGFGDASEKGYAACVYLRSLKTDGRSLVELVRAKTKVAPIRQVSLPRLELCAALLNANLLKSVREALKLPAVSLHAWSDSTVTLCWIRSSPSKLKTFVANRVSAIQEILNPSCWNHCPTSDNPADCASRGIMPSQLIAHKLWWWGPSWLSEECEHWPEVPGAIDSEQLGQELRKEHIVHLQPVSHVVEILPESDIGMFPFSSLEKIVRVSAWCFRWLEVHRSPGKTVKPYITCGEWNRTLNFWIKVAQKEHFSEDIARLKSNEPLLNKSRLLSLSPFVDLDGLLRVGGRLGLSKLPYRKRHPILLPKKHSLTKLIIVFEHRINLHALPQALEAVLRQRYWILGGRDQIRNILHKCITCRKRRAELMKQFMGMLPVARVIRSKVFQNTGVDYAGPLLIKLRPRGPVKKCWIALFICFAVKAIHLELVSSASTPAFLAAFRRFIARRGKPNNMYSDNGSNFLGANRELRELKQLLDSEKHNEIVASSLAHDNINWHNSPSSAPHFGGLWEAGVKSCKQHLKRVVGSVALTFEELNTVLCQIEACLNSRPLCPMSTDPSDLQVLTPGHFLIGSELNCLPEPDLTDVKVNRLSRWQHLQLLHQHFWKRWHTEYLTRLQQRPKWTKARTNLQVDDLVLIKEDNLPPLKWITGRVVELHPGKDKLVRVVSVKTTGGVFKRPVVKLVLLLGAEEKDIV